MTSTRTLLAAAALPLAALFLTACSTSSTGGPPLVNPLAQYELKTEAGVDRIALAPHPDGLSEAQRHALKALAARRSEATGGVVTISLPRGPASAAAGRTADAAQSELAAAGSPSQRSTYETDDAKAPVLVSFDVEKAVIPRCGRWEDLTKTGENRVYGNFGCAVTANMAAQIAHPADIARPHPEDAPDADRRQTVLSKYKDGKVTAADSPQAAPSIAHIGQ